MQITQGKPGGRDPMAADSGTSKEAVVLAHGLWTNARVLMFQRRWLASLGLAVTAISYPSWSQGLAENAGRLAKFVAATPGESVHIVAHSLGGLVALKLLADEREPRLRRVVLMGTPCAGSHCASVALATPGIALLVGQTYRDWCRLPPVTLPAGVEIGVIAGNLALGLGRLFPGLKAPNDGMIRVEETRLEAAKDRIELPVCHTGMLVSRACTRQVACFLRTGRFAHG